MAAAGRQRVDIKEQRAKAAARASLRDSQRRSVPGHVEQLDRNSMPIDAHNGGFPRVSVRTGADLIQGNPGGPGGAASMAPLRGNPEGKEDAPPSVVGGSFSRRAATMGSAATRREASVGLASPPHVLARTPPTQPQVRSIDSAMLHFGPAAAAPAAASLVAAMFSGGLQALPNPLTEGLEHLDAPVPLPCDATVVEAAAVRDGPSLGSKKIGDLAPGETVVVVEEQTADGHMRVRLGGDDDRFEGNGWVSRATNIGRDLLRGPWAASQPKPAPTGDEPLPESLTASALASTIGDLRRRLARWAQALPDSNHAQLPLPPDMARRRRKGDIAEAMRAGKKMLRRGKQAVEVVEELGPQAPVELSEAVERLSTQVGSDVVRELIGTGRFELASQWASAVAGWLGAVAALAPPLAATCVDGANTLACLCLSRSALPAGTDAKSAARPLATAAAQAVRHALNALQALRGQDKVALSAAPGVHPTAALAARCHLNGCAADGRIGRHRPALEHAVKARKAAATALADALASNDQKKPKTPKGKGQGSGEEIAGSAVAAELLVLAWHASGAQHETLDEPAFSLAAYTQALGTCKKHKATVGAALMEAIARDMKSAQKRFSKNRAVTKQEIQRGVEAERGGGGLPPKSHPHLKYGNKQQGHWGSNGMDHQKALAAAKEEMRASMFTGIHKKKKREGGGVKDRPRW